MHIAACGDDVQLMAEILLGHHHEWSTSGGAEAVRRWCTAVLHADPSLVEAQLASAWASLHLGDDAMASSTVALVAALDIPGDRGTFVHGELAMIRAHLARRRGEMRQSLREVRDGIEAAAALSADYRSHYRGALPGATSIHVGVAAVWAGELDEGVDMLTRAQSETGSAPSAVAAIHGHLAVAHWLRGDHSAQAHADLALTRVHERSPGPADFTGVCMGLILGTGTDDRWLDRAVELADALAEPIARVLGLAAEVFTVAEHDRARALRAMGELRAVVAGCPEPGALTEVCNRAAAFVGTEPDPLVGEPLTAGEERVLRMLAGSLTEREIAAELHLSHNTVRTYRRRLYKKLGVTSRAEAAQMGRSGSN